MPFLCVFGCKNPGAVLHVFPKPEKYPERFKTWASVVGPKLETLTENEVYKKKRICDIHFLSEHKNRNNRLSVLAVPLLHLPDETPSIAITAPPEIYSEIRPGEAIIQHFDNNVLLTEKVNSEQPSTSASTSVDTSDNNVLLTEKVNSEQPSTSASTSVDTSVEQREVGAKASASIVLEDHNYCVKKPKPTIRKQTIGPHGGVYKQKLKTLQHTIYVLRRKSRTFKERLASAQKLGENFAFNFVTRHMKSAQLFVHMQLQTKKKPNGRRFSIEEKILSLSLYKKSPKCYRLLSKYFTLPSSKAMKQLLSKIKNWSGH